jgi:hypothetical protein
MRATTVPSTSSSTAPRPTARCGTPTASWSTPEPAKCRWWQRCHRHPRHHGLHDRHPRRTSRRRADNRAGGPTMTQIGTEGGFLPNPVTLSNSPIGYTYNRKHITVLNVSSKNLMLGPAERADVIVDFSQVNMSDLLEHHPVQRLTGAGPGVRPALRLLHRRPRPDIDRRRADDPAPATARTPGRSCSSRSRPRWAPRPPSTPRR